MTVEEHHAVLCLILKDHATKWRVIGQYLGFTPGELDNIQSRPLLMQTAPESWLYAMLAGFLKGDLNDREGSPTLKLLETALIKAGLGATASQLRDDMQQLQGEVVNVHTLEYLTHNYVHIST